MRPTMDRTREALFSSIHETVPGAGFVDLFCAAGGVGIEALSRGASVVHFVEKQAAALDHLDRNLSACGTGKDRYRVHPVDVFRFLARGGLSDDSIRVVFADPPYGGDHAARVLAHFGAKSYDHIALLVLEHREPVEAAVLGPLAYDRTKKFGDSHLSFWNRLL
jgi:16S rRNA (guanine966-N2)-methyltransferase